MSTELHGKSRVAFSSLKYLIGTTLSRFSLPMFFFCRKYDIDYVVIKIWLDFLEIKVQPHKCISELLYCVFLYLW